MPSIAQVVIDHYNGVQTEPAPAKPARKPARPSTPELTQADRDRKDSVVNALKHGTWIVEFIKADGSQSCMECTRDGRLLPNDPTQIRVADPAQEAQAAEHLVHVYSFDRDGWRSFDIRRLLKFYKKVEQL